MYKYLKEIGNPFEEESQDLLTLTTKDIVNPLAVDTVRNVLKRGELQYKIFVSE